MQRRFRLWALLLTVIVIGFYLSFAYAAKDPSKRPVNTEGPVSGLKQYPHKASSVLEKFSPANLSDNNPGTFWHVSDFKNSAWVLIDFGTDSGDVINSFQALPRSAVPSQFWREAVLQGSNNGVLWAELADVSVEKAPSANLWLTWYFDAKKRYRYYRLLTKYGFCGHFVAFAEWRFGHHDLSAVAHTDSDIQRPKASHLNVMAAGFGPATLYILSLASLIMLAGISWLVTALILWFPSKVTIPVPARIGDYFNWFARGTLIQKNFKYGLWGLLFVVCVLKLFCVFSPHVKGGPGTYLLEASSYHESFPPFNLSDDSPGTFWHVSGFEDSTWVLMDFGTDSGEVINCFQALPRSDATSQFWREAVLQGSNNGVLWAELADVSVEKVPSANLWLTWYFDAKKRYRYYRLFITSGGFGQEKEFASFAEWRFNHHDLSAITPSTIQTPDDSLLNVLKATPGLLTLYVTPSVFLIVFVYTGLFVFPLTQTWLFISLRQKWDSISPGLRLFVSTLVAFFIMSILLGSLFYLAALIILFFWVGNSLILRRLPDFKSELNAAELIGYSLLLGIIGLSFFLMFFLSVTTFLVEFQVINYKTSHFLYMALAYALLLTGNFIFLQNYRERITTSLRWRENVLPFVRERFGLNLASLCALTAVLTISFLLVKYLFVLYTKGMAYGPWNHDTLSLWVHLPVVWANNGYLFPATHYQGMWPYLHGIYLSLGFLLQGELLARLLAFTMVPVFLLILIGFSYRNIGRDGVWESYLLPPLALLCFEIEIINAGAFVVNFISAALNVCGILAVSMWLKSRKQDYLWVAIIIFSYTISTRLDNLAHLIPVIFISVHLYRVRDTRFLKQISLLALIPLISVSPWLIRSFIYTGSPYFPIIYSKYSEVTSNIMSSEYSKYWYNDTTCNLGGWLDAGGNFRWQGLWGIGPSRVNFKWINNNFIVHAGYYLFLVWLLKLLIQGLWREYSSNPSVRRIISSKWPVLLFDMLVLTVFFLYGKYSGNLELFWLMACLVVLGYLVSLHYVNQDMPSTALILAYGALLIVHTMHTSPRFTYSFFFLLCGLSPIFIYRFLRYVPKLYRASAYCLFGVYLAGFVVIPNFQPLSSPLAAKHAHWPSNPKGLTGGYFEQFAHLRTKIPKALKVPVNGYKRPLVLVLEAEYVYGGSFPTMRVDMFCGRLNNKLTFTMENIISEMARIGITHVISVTSIGDTSDVPNKFNNRLLVLGYNPSSELFAYFVANTPEKYKYFIVGRRYYLIDMEPIYKEYGVKMEK